MVKPGDLPLLRKDWVVCLIAADIRLAGGRRRMLVPPELLDAHWALDDLEEVLQGQTGSVNLAPVGTERPAIRGTFTRWGLLNLALQLARAALTSSSTVAIHDSGWVEPDGQDGVVVFTLEGDDKPTPAPKPETRITGWPAFLIFAALVVVLVAGLVTVVQWVISFVTQLWTSPPG